MSYLHISNLYKDQRILEFKRVFCLEKIHGTSAHIRWDGSTFGFFSGGEKHERFVELFSQETLAARFKELIGFQEAVVYGEAYGGKQQGMSATYGKDLKFVVFDIKIEGLWLAVTQADLLAKDLGFEFVHYVEVPTKLEVIDAQRDAPSIQAVRNGMGEKMREGIVLRPPFEVTLNNGERLIAKHKRDEFKETKTRREVSPKELEILKEATQIADEYVTPMRLEHILDKLPEATGVEHTPLVIKAMLEDILREAQGEIVNSKSARKAISSAAAKLWKKRITTLASF